MLTPAEINSRQKWTDHHTMVWLIRHAEVEPRYHSIFGGRIDMELSQLGHRQAATLAAYLRDKDFAAVYASPMRRVQQTLAPLRGGSLPEPIILPELQEVDFGDWTGLSWEQVQARFGVSAFRWLEQLECDGIANAECAETLRERIEPRVREIVRNHKGQRVALLSHGGVIRMILAVLMGWRFSSLGAFEVDYTSITQVSVADQRARLELVNFTPWRDLPGNVREPEHDGKPSSSSQEKSVDAPL